MTMTDLRVRKVKNLPEPILDPPVYAVRYQHRRGRGRYGYTHYIKFALLDNVRWAGGWRRDERTHRSPSASLVQGFSGATVGYPALFQVVTGLAGARRYSPITATLLTFEPRHGDLLTEAEFEALDAERADRANAEAERLRDAREQQISRARHLLTPEVRDLLSVDDWRYAALTDEDRGRTYHFGVDIDRVLDLIEHLAGE